MTDIAGTDGPPEDEPPPLLLEEELPPDELEDEELEEDEPPPDDDAPDDELEPPLPPEQAAIARQAPTRVACARRAARSDDVAWCIVILPELLAYALSRAFVMAALL